MGWWRRDPSQWCRSALHRYSSRFSIRDDALLRSRCFSKSQPQPAEHKEDEDAKRPVGLSNLEWIQLQHYRRWKRRLEQDPYRALFGASNDMLSGRGLKDWEWVMKAFPKWMLKDMNIGDVEGTGKNGNGIKSEAKRETTHFPFPSYRRSNDDAANFSPETEKTAFNRASTSATPTPGPHQSYPKKIEISNDAGVNTKPWTALGVERRRCARESSGVASPSDTRRPPGNARDMIEGFNHTLRPWGFAPGTSNALIEPMTGPIIDNTGTAQSEASSRENTFIKEFLADSPKAVHATEDKSKEWRQTALDRRASPSLMLKSEGTQVPAIKPSIEVKTETDKVAPAAEPHPPFISPGERFWPAMSSRGSSPIDESSIPSSQSSGNSVEGLKENQDAFNSDVTFPERTDTIVEVAPQQATTAELSRPKAPERSTPEIAEPWSQSQNWDEVMELNRKNLPALGETEAGSKPLRSTRDILQQLPEDDLDFLSAEEIRASMGTKATTESEEERRQVREQLEEDFKKAQSSEVELDPMLESKVVNDQLVRRTERDLKAQVAPPLQSDTQIKPEIDVPESREASNSQSVIETSLDRITRLLQTSGGVVARHFWQEPVQHSEASKKASDPFLKGVVSGVEKSRASMEKVREDLETNLPCSKPLLSRLHDNEWTIIPRVGKLVRYQNNSVALSSALSARKKPGERIKVLRWALEKTEKEYEDACRVLSEVDVKTVLYPSKDRLREAFDILQKNVRLSRRMYFGLQARLESLGVNSMTPMYIDMGHRLLALRDTQFALLRLVERAMQTFGVPADGDSKVWDSTDVAAETEAAVTALARNAAANQKLEDEIEAQKASMRGLSDDGYSRPPKPIKERSFDTDSPLSHSLFRPFGVQFESLGNKSEDVKSASAARLAKSKQQEEDRALVKEVKQAYEDTYGPITIDHRQAPEHDESRTEETVEPDIARRDMEKVIGSFADLPPAPVPSSQDPPASAPQVAANSGAESIPTEEVHARGGTPGEVGMLTMPQSARSFTEAPVSENSPLPPVEYTILSYNAATDEISIMTTSSSAPESSTTSISVPEAFRTLGAPAKFMPHLPGSFDIAGVTENSLILRASSEGNTSIESKRVISETEVRDEEWKRVNPVDGTTRLSPTGYVGVDDLKEEVGRELDAIRRREEEWKRKEKAGSRAGKEEKKRRGGALAGVLKTAIIASAWCYIAGVIAEISRQ